MSRRPLTTARQLWPPPSRQMEQVLDLHEGRPARPCTELTTGPTKHTQGSGPLRPDLVHSYPDGQPARSQMPTIRRTTEAPAGSSARGAASACRKKAGHRSTKATSASSQSQTTCETRAATAPFWNQTPQVLLVGEAARASSAALVCSSLLLSAEPRPMSRMLPDIALARRPPELPLVSTLARYCYPSLSSSRA